MRRPHRYACTHWFTPRQRRPSSKAAAVGLDHRPHAARRRVVATGSGRRSSVEVECSTTADAGGDKAE
ncbi:hypothetical protein E2562_034266 [Oryza meyeriana var. granulata]|uniref:Uncharacterized protein n=1 Tax=Oryza meyeriana var. granulata TaxID=110450 RepID=A0A6G1ESI8_9ORYZ|nr:hypothetical protein E2562_034266 [Oryza meyeriana var. granulata]